MKETVLTCWDPR